MDLESENEEGEQAIPQMDGGGEEEEKKGKEEKGRKRTRQEPRESDGGTISSDDDEQWRLEEEAARQRARKRQEEEEAQQRDWDVWHLAMAWWQAGQKAQQAQGEKFRRQLAARRELFQDRQARIDTQMERI